MVPVSLAGSACHHEDGTRHQGTAQADKQHAQQACGSGQTLRPPLTARGATSQFGNGTVTCVWIRAEARRAGSMRAMAQIGGPCAPDLYRAAPERKGETASRAG
ncbi:hypothetical protein AAFF_G00022600 [Aldrovandia affinis]|uniref:Uncharacterized protein n=1 Tax=Aldrovandia affinis TaxID=143900 RepID=A0AAD7T5C1_9TELE|nr:hypothetical protein AAFF_G00022600 [Aldrovandia affinis]